MKINYDYKNGKQYECFNYRRKFGGNYVTIKCPFCGNEERAYVWSLAGSGKRCSKCGAKHTGIGMTYPIIK